ncbi:hypothetical protein BDF14DRAFT_1833860 [Spinellus fusiger]|nr:hypothetical protein BDF14DRAFT_1833860 [Spinellus fusiger]
MTNLIQILLNSEDSNGNRAAAGGSIILIICEFLWIFLLASNEDSWLVNKASNMNHTGIGSKAVLQNHLGNLRGSNVHPDTSNEASLPTHTPPATSPKPNTKNNSTSPMAPTMSEKNEARISKALHNYTSSPEDPNELSFEKGESLEIIDRSGNWWRARKTDGIEGIVPSNYVRTLLSDGRRE